MIQTLAVSGYRSLRDLVLPLGRLNLVTGANGSGKSSLYRALRLLRDAALNAVVASLAREGGLRSTLWAGPETISRSMRRGERPVEGTVRKKPVSLKLGFGGEPYSYCIDLGFPPPSPTLFRSDPAIKRECIWHGAVYRPASAMVDRRDGLVSLPGEARGESVCLTTKLSHVDSMLATIADPQRAPEMLEVREGIRSWRFYDSFRTDPESPVRAAQVGTFTPVLNSDGTDLPAALATIREIGDSDLLDATIEDAFPGSRMLVSAVGERLELQLQQHGLLRPLSAAELSDGTLRFLLWTAALLTPRPPKLMVLNEPETSLHPDLLPALARLILAASERGQLIVVSHAPVLIEALLGEGDRCTHLRLEKSFGESALAGATLLHRTHWVWPAR